MVEETTLTLSEEGQDNLTPNGYVKDAEKLKNHSVEVVEKADGGLLNFDQEFEFCNGVRCHDGAHEKFVQMLMELKFQNEYLKAQFAGLRCHYVESSEVSERASKLEVEEEESNTIKELSEKISELKKELQEQREMQTAAEDALNHLRIAYSDADAKAQDLAAKLIEVQQKMDQEVKERDEKNVDLESKVSRLHKRAKQKIQELQKEKDDIEARFHALNEAAEKASSEQSSLQQELERARQNANEVLRSIEVERQQLRNANSKLRESNDELCHSLETKENALEGLQQSLLEKDQMIEEMRKLLESASEKKEASIADLTSKHQKHTESLEGQLADAISERSKAAETVSSLQALIAEKESEIAELEASSTGEAVRLRASVDAMRGELTHCKQEHEKEKNTWVASYQALKNKLEMAENQCLRSEIESEKLRSKMELELSVQNQLLNSKDSELAAAKEEINRLESEFSSYKARAHVLLQKKDAELLAAKDTELIKVQEEAIKEVEKDLEVAIAERDKAIQDLHTANANYAELLAARDVSIHNVEKQIKQVEMKLKSTHTRYLLEKEEWQKTLESVEKSWRLKFEALEAKNKERHGVDLQKELEELKLQYVKLQGEHASFRDIADRMIEEKGNEISRLLTDNKNLRQSVESRPLNNGNQNTAFLKQDVQASNIEAAEQQILLLARQQAQREEQLTQSQRHILALQEEIEELERENRLHSQQQAMLKAELREMERSQKREGVDMTYLKNVILKLLETGEVEALLPVVGMLLQFSPEEIRRCQQAYNASSNGLPSSSSDGSASGSSSLFSRFAFT